MGRSRAIYLVLGLLGPVAGCQSISRDTLVSPLSTSGSKPGTPTKAEMSPEATAEVCLVTADALDKAGQDTEAIALYEKARQSGSHKQQISRRLAVLYDRQGNFPRALVEYKQLLQRNPKDPELLNDLGYCFYSQGKWTEAENYLKQAVAANPKHARAWINLGMTLAQDHRPEESLAAFGNVVSPAQAQCNLAFILTTQKKFDDAKVAYRQALAMEPDLRVAQGALAKLEKTGQDDKVTR